MATYSSSEGIVLGYTLVGEGNHILRILTRKYGKISLYARRKTGRTTRSQSLPELLDHGRFEYLEKGPKKGLSNLRSFLPLQSYPAIRLCLDRVCLASLLVEATDALLPEHELEHSLDEEEVYSTLSVGLKALEEAGTIGEKLKATFYTLVGIVKESGHLPEGITAATPRSLRQLMEIVENHRGRALRSRESIEQILRGLR